MCPEGFTIDDMAADIAGLIEFLRIGPCRIVGFSMGGIIVQELLLAYPDLITQAVLMATLAGSMRCAPLSRLSPLPSRSFSIAV